MNFSQNPVLLIDGSSLAYLHAGRFNYYATIREHIEGMLRRFKTTKFLIVLEKGSTNFRNKIAVSSKYKGNRKTEKAKENIKKYLPYLTECFQEIKDNYKPVTYLGVENDDVISILSRRIPNVIMCSNDVDYLAKPGMHFNLKTHKITHVTLPGTIELVNKKIKATGYYQTYTQLLKGSAKENYKGLPGYGHKKVYNILKDLKTEKEMQDVCVELFKQEFPNDWWKKIKEGFQLSFLLEENDSLITPEMIDINDI